MTGGFTLPHVVETIIKPPDYPAECPYCRKRNAETFFLRKFKRAKWMLPAPTAVFAGYKDYKVAYPSCNRCANFFKYSKWVSYILILIPWSFFFYLIMESSQTNTKPGDISLIIALCCSIFSLLLLCYRFYRVLGFRIGYIGEKSILYYSRSKSFSEKFAKLNDSESVFRIVAFKFK